MDPLGVWDKTFSGFQKRRILATETQKSKVRFWNKLSLWTLSGSATASSLQGIKLFGKWKKADISSETETPKHVT